MKIENMYRPMLDITIAYYGVVTDELVGHK